MYPFDDSSVYNTDDILYKGLQFCRDSFQTPNLLIKCIVMILRLLAPINLSCTEMIM